MMCRQPHRRMLAHHLFPLRRRAHDSYDRAPIALAALECLQRPVVCTPRPRPRNAPKLMSASIVRRPRHTVGFPTGCVGAHKQGATWVEQQRGVSHRSVHDHAKRDEVVAKGAEGGAEPYHGQDCARGADLCRVDQGRQVREEAPRRSSCTPQACFASRETGCVCQEGSSSEDRAVPPNRHPSVRLSLTLSPRRTPRRRRNRKRRRLLRLLLLLHLAVLRAVVRWGL